MILYNKIAPIFIACTVAILLSLPGIPVAEEVAIRERFDNDVTLRQVAIEALMVEVNEDVERKYGINYTLNRDETKNEGNVFEGANVGFPFKSDQVYVPVFRDTRNGYTIDRISQLPGIGLNLVGIDIPPGQLSAQIRLLITEGKARIRTHPIVVALHGTTAKIETVEEIPFQDVTFTNKGDPYLDVKYEKVGVKLEVIPRVRDIEKGLIELEIKTINVSAVSQYVTIQQVNRPVFAESIANTTMELKSGETLIIGGLKTQREVTETNQVPILGSIPLIGWLFKNRTKEMEVKDTLFFITPHLLEPDQSPILPWDFVHGIPLTMKEEK